MKSPEEFASEVSESVSLYVHALKGAYLGLRLAGSKSRAQNATSFFQFANFATNSFMTMLDNSIDQLDDISEGRLQDYKGQMLLLAKSVADEYRLRILGGSLREGELNKLQSGSLGLLAQVRAATEIPKAEDTAGRKWEAPKLAAVISRDFAYQSHVDAFYESYRLGSSPVIGLPIARHQNTDLTVILEIGSEKQRNEVFHFNSKFYPEVKHV